MIVPMKKIFLLMQSKDATCTLEQLRSLGLLHIEHQKLPQGQEINAICEDIRLVSRAINILFGQASNSADKTSEEDSGNWRSIAVHLVDLDVRVKRLEEYSFRLKKQISQWESWGEFDPLAVANLNKKQVLFKLYQIPVKDMDNLPPGLIVKKISTAEGMVNCVIICRQEFSLPFQELALPKISLNNMRHRLEDDGRAIAAFKEEIKINARYLNTLIQTKKALENDLEFQEALKGLGNEGNIVYVSGYIPLDAAARLKDIAQKHRWGLLVKEPADDDVVPTLIRNPRWVSLINPVFKMIEIIPGYRELDTSLWFLIFFSIFFGMLIGDAGYGLIYFLITLFAQKKWSRKLNDRSVFILFYILSSCAICWGLLTGTFFGQAWLPAYFKPLMPLLQNDKNLQALCFLIGATHLSVAHIWRFILKFPSLASWADIGWVSILWGGFFLARTLVLGYSFPSFGKWFFVVGPLLVVLFSSPRKNILRGVGAGLGNLSLNLVNSFTDVVSYIRLFAVGLATVAVADAFNSMAMSIGFSNLLRAAATSLILIFGHALNLLLGPMSVLVHGIRLNVLEFSNHLDVKWSGFAYKPLKALKG